MKWSSKKLLMFAILISLSLAAFVHFRGQAGTYPIVEVYDGDTIAVDMEGVTEKVRMIGADTPETVDPRKEVQCGGPEASAFTHTHLTVGARVRLVADPLSTDRDRYGRLLRYVYVQDGELYNRQLIRLGFARAYLGFPFSLSEDFRAAQSAAQAQHLGVWAAC
jgi:micrococcal nuclease